MNVQIAKIKTFLYLESQTAFKIGVLQDCLCLNEIHNDYKSIF